MSETRDLAVINPSQAHFPSAEELKTLKEMATTFIQSGLLPKAIDRPEKAIVVMLKGKEAGVPPLQALAHIHVIEGKPSMSAELMLSQLQKNIPGFGHQFVQTDNKACIMKVRRPPSTEWQTFGFSMADAQAAGLTNKQVWRNYPAAMLRARCISAMARAVGPDALAGISYTPEELGAEVDGAGSFVGSGGGTGGAPTDKAARLAALNLRPEPKEVASEVVLPNGGTVVLPAEPPVDPPQVPEPLAAPSEPDWSTGLPTTVGAPLADYVIKTKSPYKDKRLRDLTREQLEGFLATLRAWAKANTPLTGGSLEDASRMDDYLRVNFPPEFEPGSTG